MKPAFFVLAAALAVCGINPAMAADAPFGCLARAPHVCHFRIFYARGDRIVILPAGMQNKVPDLTIGIDQYCMSLDETPVFSCQRKRIDNRYNS